MLPCFARTGNRKDPRIADIYLKPNEDLMLLRRELKGMMDNPRAFLGMVFKTDVDLWVDRCSSIITEVHSSRTQQNATPTIDDDN